MAHSWLVNLGKNPDAGALRVRSRQLKGCWSWLYRTGLWLCDLGKSCHLSNLTSSPIGSEDDSTCHRTLSVRLE